VIRHRLAYAYPGKNTVGLAFVLLEGDTLGPFAIGSVSDSAVGEFFSSFSPEVLYIPTEKDADKYASSFNASFKRLRFKKPGWKEFKVPPYVRGLKPGRLAINAWKMLADDLIRGDGIRIVSWTPTELTIEWARVFGPRKLNHDG
jgi:hypothetical protein